jgi:hypothetical protein
METPPSLPKRQNAVHTDADFDRLDRIISENEAGALCGKTGNAMAIDRCRGKGPPFIRQGRSVGYTRRDIFEYLANMRVVPP